MFLKISLALFFSLVFSKRAYPSCYDLFSVPSESQVFEIMKKHQHNYIEFSLGGGTAKASVLRYDFRKHPRFVDMGDNSHYEESYIFKVLEDLGHESLHFLRDEPSGLRAIVAIYNSLLGSGFAVGGTRIWNYKNEGEALLDALRLSKGMTYKSAMAGLPLGGGKAVILASANTEKTEKLLRAYGAFLYLINQVARQNGIQRRFATGEDVGMSLEDISTIDRSHPGLALGLPGKSGDPSILTAQGVVVGIESAVHHVFGTRDLKGLDIHVQGLGNVGSRVVGYLSEKGANISVYDIDVKKTSCLSKQLGLTIKSSEQILTGQCHLFVPCALGAVVNAQTVNHFNCKIIAGSANNQLEETQQGDILKERGILYAPDYVINAGGVISVSRELFGKDEAWATQKTGDIYHTLSRIFQKAEKENIGTHTASDRLAEEIIYNSE